MTRMPFRGRVTAALGLVLLATVVLAAVLVPPLGLAQLTLLAFLLPVAAIPLPRAPVRARAAGSSQSPRDPRAPPLS